MRSCLLVLALVLASQCLIACETGAASGAPCSLSSECRAPLACRLGRCRNECSENRDCAGFARCLLDPAGLGACSLVTDDRCGSGGTECASGLTCVNERCANTCTDAAQCPADGECREADGAGVSFCFAPDREDGGAASPDADESDAGVSGALAIAVSQTSVCVVRADHHVVCWGGNGSGQLGDGDDPLTPHDHGTDCVGEDCSLVPVEVIGMAGAPLLATDIAATSDTFCAIALADARVQCWGGCTESTCVLGTDQRRARADVLVYIPVALSDVHGGRAHFCARALTGEAWCWGQNLAGQMGVVGEGYRHDVAPAWDQGTLALGSQNTCALFADGRVLCAGDNAGGALGPEANVETDSATPILVPFATAPTALSAGEGFACALVEGAPWCWGDSSLAELGRTTGDCVTGVACDPVPAPANGTERFVQLWGDGFSNVTCAARADGAVFCWGASQYGQSGRAPVSGGSPLDVARLGGARDVAMGIRDTCAILSTGAVRCMGSNERGVLQMPPDAIAHWMPVDVCIDLTCP